MCQAPLVTTVVGSYPQPDWLVDKEKLRGRLPPRVRAREIWKVPEKNLEEAQDAFKSCSHKFNIKTKTVSRRSGM